MPIPKKLVKINLFWALSFKRRWDGYELSIALYHRHPNSKTYIGSIVLRELKSKQKVRRFETHSGISHRYHNKKVGIFLYSLAADYCIKNKFLLYSSMCPSNSAARVWKSKTLGAYYKVVKHSRRWQITKPIKRKR